MALLLIILITVSAGLVDSLTNDELQAMSDLRTSLGGAVFNVTSTSKKLDPCSWSNVKCSENHVSSIVIRHYSLSGKNLPSTVSSLKHLTELNLENNSLTGDLPTLNGFTRLQKLYLNTNNFTSMPIDFFDGMISLQELVMDQNPSLSSWQITPALSSATELIIFTAASANINGNIPSFLGNLPGLTTLKLPFNDLSGGLPDTFSGSGIETLILTGQKQKLNGGIEVLQNMTALSDAELNMNKFTGCLPDFSPFSVLQNLLLKDNLLTGPIPNSMISLPQLKHVELGNNYLQGPIPKFPKTVTLDLNGTNSFCTKVYGRECNTLVDSLISVLKSWRYPLFFATNWTGNSPCSSSWIGITCNGKDVIGISLSNKSLSGTISSSFSSLIYLQVLNLSNNNLTGEIPRELSRLTHLREVDISNNNLCGMKPSFPSYVSVNVDGNLNIGRDCQSSEQFSSKGKEHTKNNKVVLFSVCIIVGAISVIIFGIWWWRKNKHEESENVQSTQSSPLQPQQQHATTAGPSTTQVQDVDVDEINLNIPIEILRQATKNFSEDNVIGSGGFGTVYKGEFPDGTKVAVKRTDTKHTRSKGTVEFKAEISVLTKVRHRHLVSLLGYCLDGNERLLVYEYLPLGNLSRYLLKWNEEGLRPLEWATRLSIALDVARGVEYLHTLANQTFIHRDLKPSNILLGDNMRAKVGDFGLVRVVQDDKASFNTKLAGTFGYVAPEYAVTGRVTTKVDVYSFGAILMGMITGRKAVDESKSEDSMHLVTWFRRMHINKDSLPEVIDPTIQQDEETLASINKVAELAFHCTAREPHQRPDMNHAVSVLHSLAEFWKPSEPEEEESVDADNDMNLPLSETLRRWTDNQSSSSHPC